MKRLKLLILILFLGLTFSCSSDNEDTSTTPITIEASGTVNWASFDKTNLDITSLVTFGGQPASTYTVSTIKGDKIIFNFNKGTKSASKVNREILFVEIQIDSPTLDDGRFIESITYIENLNLPIPNVDANLGFEIGNDAPENYDGKFNMLVQIIEDGFLLPGFYIIDPKIRIRSNR